MGKSYTKFLLWSIFSFCAIISRNETFMKEKPNIVLVTIDSLRADFVGYYNKNEKNTPFLDSFAQDSYVFTNAISPANPTFFCYCSIMTGTLPFTYGNYLGIPNNKEIKTLAEILRDNGYSTTAFLADSPALYSIYGYERGFDTYDDGYENVSKVYLSSQEFLMKLREKTPENLLSVLEIIRTFIKAIFLSPEHSVPGHKLNKKVINFFNNKDKKPFFLWLHYMDNHLPYFGGLNRHFFQNKNPIQRIINKVIFYKELTTSLRIMKTKNKKITEIFREAYRSSVKNTDEYIGKIINFLKYKYPNTVFIVASDHGEAFMEHGVVGHGALSLYNELIHIPLIINLPSAKSKIVTQAVSLVSIAKTISSIAGIKVSQFEGNNLISDRIFSPINSLSRILYKCLSPNVHLGILDNETEIRGYKNLWSFTTPKEKYIVEEDGEIEEYYLLSKDPLERNNLIKNKVFQKSKIVEQFKKTINKE